MTESVFAKFGPKAWPYRFKGEIEVGVLVGGIPTDQRVIEGWLKKKLFSNEDDKLLIKAVLETMADRGVEFEQAAADVIKNSHLNGFKRDEKGLYIEGRQLKACIKEGANVAVASGKIKGGRSWGKTNKGLMNFLAEHIFVEEERLHLGRMEPDGTHQRFVHTQFHSIQYEEYCENVTIPFTVQTDWEWPEDFWMQMWLTAERQGLGATRSQGYGTFAVTKWEKAAP